MGLPLNRHMRLIEGHGFRYRYGPLELAGAAR
jgi:hypothetical protein